VPSRGSHAARTRGTRSPTRGHGHPGVPPRSTSPTPPVLFARWVIPEPYGNPARALPPSPWGHPTLRGTSLAVTCPGRRKDPHRALWGMLAADAVSGPGQLCPASRRTVTHAVAESLDIQGCCTRVVPTCVGGR